jgi:hypothetical protein
MDRAACIQQAKFNYTGASRRLHDAISQSYLLCDSYYSLGDDESLTEIAATCGPSEEVMAIISGMTALLSSGQ